MKRTIAALAAGYALARTYDAYRDRRVRRMAQRAVQRERERAAHEVMNELRGELDRQLGVSH